MRGPARAALLVALHLAGGRVLLAQAPSPRPTPPRSAVPAQGADAEVRGIVVEGGGVPVGGAAVAVRAGSERAVVAGAIAPASGRFRVQGLAPGAYTLRVTRLGYAPRTRAFTIARPGERLDLDTVQLARVAVTLSGVTVQEEAAAVTMAPDRNSYRARDVAPAAANASEVLEQVPSVQVDAEGRVSLRGNENVIVQINGRPTPLRGAALAAFLKQLPGPVVERIEVVPNPSAKQDPEGLGGIINVVLRQETDLGRSAGVSLAAMNADRWNGTANVGWQRGAVMLFGSYGYNSDGRRFTGINDRERFDLQHQLTGVTEQDLAGATVNRGHNLTGNAELRIGRRDVLSQALVANVRTAGEDSRLSVVERDGALVPGERYLRPRRTDTDGLLLDWTTAWRRTLAPRRHELAAEVRLNRTVDTERNGFARRSADGGTLLEAEAFDLDARATQLTAQVDYTRPLGGATRLETGWRANSRWLDRDLDAQRDATGRGTWLPSPLGNAFGFDEHVQAGYGVLTRTVRRLEVQGGLRAEYTGRVFALADARYPYDYFSLFPSAALSWGGTGATQLRLGYGRRIRRPGTGELNPFPQFFDAQNVFVGNPALRPEFTDALEGGLTRTGRRGTLQLSPFFRRTTDVIRVEVEPDAVVDGRPVTTVSYLNLATSNSYGADVNGTLTAWRKLTAVTSFNVFRLVTDGGSASALASDALAWSARLNATWQATPGLAVQGTYFYRAPYAIERGRWAAFQTTTFVVRHKVRGDRGLVSLRVLDPFNTNRFAIRAGTERLLQLTAREPGVRGVFVGFQYNTGQAPRLRPVRQDPQPAPSTGFGP